VLLLACSALMLGVVAIYRALRWRLESNQLIAGLRTWGAKPLAQPRALMLGLVGGSVIYLLLNSSLFGLASPHFDLVSSKVWVYVASRDGLSDLYYRTLIVPAAGAWNGVPWHEA